MISKEKNMTQTIAVKRALRETIERARQRRIDEAPTDLSRFQPLMPAARQSVNDLIKRGASLVRVTPDRVVMKRLDSYVSVDSSGRISWNSEETFR
jgi:hypothetical protein